VILEADGEPLASFEDLRETVLASEGRAIPISVWRDGETIELEITPPSATPTTARAASSGG
jgi:regulator of sigma E protease